MTVPSSLQDFLNTRQEVLTGKFEAFDVPAMLEHYDPEINFSDHAWQATNMNYDGLKSFLESTFTTCASLKLDTHGVHGTSKDFCVWEWTLKIVSKVDDPVRHLHAGKEIWFRGCSLHWWKCTSGRDGSDISHWRIIREGDYALPIPVSGELKE